MDKSKALYDTQALQSKAQAYQDIATWRYRQQFSGEGEAQNVYEQTRGRNQMIEEVLDKIRNENPDLDVILSKCIGWW